jgi:hypothetical protein
MAGAVMAEEKRAVIEVPMMGACFDAAFVKR